MPYNRSRYFLGVCSSALLLTSFVVGLEVTAATARPEAAPILNSVNRALKADRLPARADRATPVEQDTSARLPDGCEALVSTIERSPLARIPGRCVS